MTARDWLHAEVARYTGERAPRAARQVAAYNDILRRLTAAQHGMGAALSKPAGMWSWIATPIAPIKTEPSNFGRWLKAFTAKAARG